MTTSAPIRTTYKTWTRDNFLISTDPSLIPLQTLNDFLSSPDVYWATGLPLDALHQTVQNSLCFALYDLGLNSESRPQTQSEPVSSQEQASTTSNVSTAPLRLIGLARCITDSTTFLYLTDVYVAPSYQGQGLGRWLVRCVRETCDEMPYLRRSLCFTSNWERSVPLYEELLGMSVVECGGGGKREGLAVLMKKGPGSTF